MNFVYPFFNTATHEILSKDNISYEYPSGPGGQRHYSNATLVSVIRENVGLNCEWCLVRPLNVDNESDFYIPIKDLKNISFKKTYEVPSKESNIDLNKQEVDIKAQKLNIPFFDEREGLYSVRIAVDYDIILDIGQFYEVMKQAYYTGVSILLGTYGAYPKDQETYKNYRPVEGNPSLSDLPYFSNNTIDNLESQFYTFAYIHKDFDQTTKSECENISYTVSIPKNFFEQFIQEPETEPPPTGDFSLGFTNKDFYEKIDKLIGVITQYDVKLKEELYPNKTAIGYLTEYELSSIKQFSVSLIEFINSLQKDIYFNQFKQIFYKFNFLYTNDENSFSLVALQAFDGKDETAPEIYRLTDQQIRLFNLSKVFDKRIFNYLKNLDNIIADIDSTVKQFFDNYVRYPNADIVMVPITVSGEKYSPEQVEAFSRYNSKREESCLTLTDILNFTDNVYDSIGLYHYFTQNNTNKDTPSVDIKKQLEENQKYLQNMKGDVPPDLKIDFGTDGLAAFLGQNPKNIRSLRDVSNTIFYVSAKLDLQQILLKYFICLLKNGSINDPTIAEYVTKMPSELVNYLMYLDNIKKLDGAKYAEYLIRGIPGDFNLICSAEMAYFLKGLKKFLKAFGGVLSGIYKTINFIHTEDAQIAKLTEGIAKRKEITNPYKALVKSLEKTFWLALSDIVFGFVREILTAECEDPPYKAIVGDDFVNPFDTHYPQLDDNGEYVNNNEDILKDNIQEAAEQSIPDIILRLNYGVDFDYTIDLLDKLIKNVKCLLDPVDLFEISRGIFSDENKRIVTDLIERNYSSAPNDLTYLLEGNNLELFFKKLGGYTDPQVYEEYVTGELEYNLREIKNLCSTDVEKARETLYGKYPKDLDVLADANARRAQKAREVLQKLQKGDETIVFSALCSELEDEDVTSTKKDIIEEQKETVRSLFKEALNTFNSEIESYPEQFKEETDYIREFYNENNRAVESDSYPYSLFLSDLYYNLIDSTNFTDKRSLFVGKERNVDFSVLEGMYLKREANVFASEDNDCNVSTGSANTIGSGEFFEEFLRTYLRDGKVILTDSTVLKAFNLGGVEKNYYDMTIRALGLGSKQIILPLFDLTSYPDGRLKRKQTFLSIANEEPDDLDDDLWPILAKSAAHHIISGHDFLGARILIERDDQTFMNQHDNLFDNDPTKFDTIFPPQPNKKSVKNYYFGDYPEKLLYSTNFSKQISTDLEKYIQEKGDVVFVSIAEEAVPAGYEPTQILFIKHIFWDESSFDYRIYNYYIGCNEVTVERLFLDQTVGEFTDLEIFKYGAKESKNIRTLNNVFRFPVEMNMSQFPIENMSNGDEYKNIETLKSFLYDPSRIGIDPFNGSYTYSDVPVSNTFLPSIIQKEIKFFSDSGDNNGLTADDDPEQLLQKLLDYIGNGSTGKLPIKNFKVEKDNYFKYKNFIWNYDYKYINEILDWRKLRGVTEEQNKCIVLNENFLDNTSRPSISAYAEKEKFLYPFDFLKNVLIKQMPKIYQNYKNKEEFNNVINLLEQFKQDGIFNLEHIIGNTTNVTKINVPVTSLAQDGDLLTPIIKYEEHYSIKNDKIEGINYNKLIAKRNEIPKIIAKDLCYGIDEYKISKGIDTRNQDISNWFYLKPYFDFKEICLTPIPSVIAEYGILETIADFFKAFVGIGPSNIEDRYGIISEPDQIILKQAELGQDKSLLYSLTTHPDYSPITANNYFKINSFFLKRPQQIKDNQKCTIEPHYLNLEYYLKVSSEKGFKKLCDDNIPTTFGIIIDECLVNLTVRAYVTDYLIKCIPFLSLISIKDLKELHKNKILIDIIANNMKLEMKDFTNHIPLEGDGSERNYYNAFIKKANDVLIRDYSDVINFSNRSEDEIKTNLESLNFFISKNISYCINFLINKNIIIPKNNLESLVYKVSENYKSILEGDNVELNTINSVAKSDIYLFGFNYFLMYSKINPRLKVSLHGTKREFAKLFFKTSHISKDEDAESNYPDESNENADAIVSAIIQAGQSQDPIILAGLKKNINYIKYIKFFLSASAVEARRILLTAAKVQDKAIRMTRITNFALALANSLAYSFIDQEELEKWMINYAKKTNFSKFGTRKIVLLNAKRAQEGKSPLYDIAVAVPYMFKYKSTAIGLSYLGADLLLEMAWNMNSLRELAELKRVADEIQPEVCQTVGEITQEQTCEYTVRTLNSLETNEGLYSPTIYKN